jgi:hypothetical protein
VLDPPVLTGHESDKFKYESDQNESDRSGLTRTDYFNTLLKRGLSSRNL